MKMNEILNEKKQVRPGCVQSDCALISCLLADKLRVGSKSNFLELMCGSRLLCASCTRERPDQLRRENRLPTAHRPQMPKKAKWHNFTFVQGG
jgi:hypothetical protein